MMKRIVNLGLLFGGWWDCKIGTSIPTKWRKEKLFLQLSRVKCGVRIQKRKNLNQQIQSKTGYRNRSSKITKSV